MNKSIEEWKDIPGYEGMYQVSSFGRVKSVRKFKKSKHGCNIALEEKVIRPFVKSKKANYLRVSLIKDGKRTKYSVHRLVAMAFIPNPNNLPQVNHKDENKENNRVDNLEWCDGKYNINYGTARERITKTQMETMSTMKKVQCIETGVIYKSIKDAGRKLNICAENISAVCNQTVRHNGKGVKYIIKTAGGYHWRFVEE